MGVDGSGYVMPEVVFADDDLLEICAKLSEETGEVCQAVVKNRSVHEIASELLDVQQVTENMFRHIGYTDGMMSDARAQHWDKMKRRGFLKKDVLL